MHVELRAIIFDFNGVIVDDEPLHLELLRRVFAEERLPLSDEDYFQKYLGLNDRGCFNLALTEAGRNAEANDESLIAQLIARKSAFYLQAIADRSLLFPGVVELIQNLAERFPLAIASGALRQEIETVLQREGIREYFSVIVAAEDVRASKPDPEGFLKALALLNAQITTSHPQIESRECLVIEDSIAGVNAARRAGMRCVAVTSSYSREKLFLADWIIDRVTELDPLNVFAKLNGQAG